MKDHRSRKEAFKIKNVTVVYKIKYYIRDGNFVQKLFKTSDNWYGNFRKILDHGKKLLNLKM